MYSKILVVGTHFCINVLLEKYYILNLNFESQVWKRNVLQRNLDHVYKNWGCYPSLANSICQFFMFQWWNLGGQIGWYYHRGCDQINCPIFDVVCNRFSKSHISDGSKKSKISKMCSSTGKNFFKIFFSASSQISTYLWI